MKEDFTKNYIACAIKKQLLLKESLGLDIDKGMLGANTANDKLSTDAPYNAYVHYKDFVLLDVYNKTGLSITEYLELTHSETKLLIKAITDAGKEKSAAEEQELKKRNRGR